MRSVYRAFKKHYLMCKDVYTTMVATGGFRFKMKLTQDRSEARLETPDEDLTMRFVVVMRRFLNPADRLYYKAVWTQLLAEFSDAIPAELKEAIEKRKIVLANGIMRFEMDGELITAERMYEIIADGIRFDHSDRYREILLNLEQLPLVGPLFWHQFYSYTENALSLASWLFEAISAAEKTEKFQQLYGDPPVARCIYCLSTEGPFRSEEHILPEAMGNHDYVLPRGYVCDPCNNGVLAGLDAELCNSPLFVSQRVNAVEYDKRGRLPEVRIGDFIVKRTDPMNVTWIADPGSDAIKVGKTRPDGMTPLRMKTKLPKRFDETVLARALCKIGLAAIALDFGHDYACSSRFDRVRQLIREGGEYQNNLLICQWMTMDTDIGLQYRHQPEVPGTVMAHQIYGVTLLMNLEEEPVLKLAPIHKQLGFVSFPLYGKRRRTNLKLRFVSPPNQVA
jgi:hypothetical protein